MTQYFFLKIESCSVRVLKYRVYIYTHVYICVPLNLVTGKREQEGHIRHTK